MYENFRQIKTKIECLIFLFLQENIQSISWHGQWTYNMYLCYKIGREKKYWSMKCIIWGKKPPSDDTFSLN